MNPVDFVLHSVATLDGSIVTRLLLPLASLTWIWREGKLPSGNQWVAQLIRQCSGLRGDR